MNKQKILFFLLVPFMLATMTGCGLLVRGIGGIWDTVTSSVRNNRVGSLSSEEQGWARTAWKYFENNYNSSTGLVNSTNDHPVTSLWTIGDYIIALSTAYELQLIEKPVFDQRLTKLVSFLNSMELLSNRLPNHYYSTANSRAVKANGEVGKTGWSVQDMGRLLVALKIARERYPEYAEYIEKAVLRWNLCDALDSAGNLRSGVVADKGFKTYDELKFGMKQYVSRGFQAWGFNTAATMNPDPYESLQINGVKVHYDGRDEREDKSVNAVISLPYLLDGMEFQWQSVGNCARYDYIEVPALMEETAQSVYKAQEKRYQEEKAFTARTSHSVSGEPYFVYDALFANGYTWNTVSGDGKYHPQLALVATKAAFGMWVLWSTEYTAELIKVVSTLHDPAKGWYEGRREQTGAVEYSLTASTNSTVLEALLFKNGGAVYHTPVHPETFYDLYSQETFLGRGRCIPLKKNTCK